MFYKNKIRFILCACAVLCAQAAWAQQIQEILPKDAELEFIPGTQFLMQTGTVPEFVMEQTECISHTFYKTEPVISLLPKNSLVSSFNMQLPSGDTPDLVIESLYVLKLRDSDDDAADMQKIADIVRSFSTLEGTTYISSDEKIETLYHKAYTIDNPESKNKIPDQLDTLVNGQRVYVYQNDNSFNDCVYSVDYKLSGNTIMITMVTTDAIKMGPIRAVKPQNVSINFLIELAEDGVIMHCIVMSKFVNVPFIKGRIERSFQARTDAMFQWFVNHYID